MEKELEIVDTIETPVEKEIKKKETRLAQQIKKIKKMKRELEQEDDEEEDEDEEEKNKRLDYKKRWERDHKMVRGQFTYHEIPGGTMSFSFFKWLKDPVKEYIIQDGEILKLPLMVAEHLNKNCKYPVHHHSLDENGKPRQTIGRTVHRTSFRSLDFMGEDIESRADIITVSNL